MSKKSIGNHNFPFRSGMPEYGLDCIRFETNNTSDPDGVVDPAGIVDGVVRTSQSLFTITLKLRYARIFAWAEYQEAESIRAHITSVTEGIDAENKIVVRIEDGNLTLNADTTDKTVVVFALLGKRT